MTTNERYFHLIGFLDAIIYLERTQQLALSQDSGDEDDYEPENEEEREEIEQLRQKDMARYRALQKFILSFETGEDW